MDSLLATNELEILCPFRMNVQKPKIVELLFYDTCDVFIVYICFFKKNVCVPLFNFMV